MAIWALSACMAPRATLDLRAPAEPLVWPAPPEPPRMRWEGELVGEENFSHAPSRMGMGERLLGWVTGLVFGEAHPLRLRRPMSGAWDERTRRLYVTDVGLRGVVVFDFHAHKVRLWAGAGELAFHTPVAVVVMPDSTLWVSDAEQGRLFHLDHDGRLLGQAGVGQLRRPTGMCRDGNGRLLVADSATHRIVLFDGHGRRVGQWGGRGRAPGRFNGPTHLACQGGRVAVADTLNARVQILDEEGQPIRVLGRRGDFLGDTPRPKGVAWDPQGRLYVVESLFDHLLVYDGEGRALLPIGGSGSSPGRFQLPAGAWSDAEGRIYVADMFNRRVAVFHLVETGGDGTRSE